MSTFAQVLRECRSDDNPPLSKAALITAVAQHVTINSTAAAQFLQTIPPGNLRIDTALELLASLTDPLNLIPLLNVLSDQEQEELLQSLGLYLRYTRGNPTGHFKLDLGL